MHDRFGFLPDFTGDFIGIALLVLWQKELDRKRTGIALIRECAKNADERADTVAGNDSRGVVEQLARHIGYVLKVDMTNFAGPERIEVLELVEPGPEVIAVEHGREIGMRRGTGHLHERRQRGDEGRRAHEFDP